MTDMNTLPAPKTDGAGIVSWVHFGDLHVTTAQEQNYHDFLELTGEVNNVMADALSFAFFPGDNAEHGRAQEYELVRRGLDRLALPCFSIVGDHDVRTGSFDNYLRYMARATCFRFVINPYLFLGLNAFATADAKRFDVSKEQLEWAETLLASAKREKRKPVIFLHCYPSDLGKSGKTLSNLIRKYGVLLVDMGHTHYNEIANDGHTLYTTTRSTGQVEEGPVGFSITNLDHGVISWRFKVLGEWPFVMITSPGDERLMTDSALASLHKTGSLRVRAKVWSRSPIQLVNAQLPGQQVDLENIPGTAVWEGELSTGHLGAGVYPLYVYAEDEDERASEDIVHVPIGCATGAPRERAQRDQDNAIWAWPEHGLLGTQLGPNKNGRKW